MSESVPRDANSTLDSLGLLGSADGAQAALLPGTPLGRYVILSRVGVGGLGVVYAAYDPQIDRRVAIKLLKRSEGAEGGGRERMVREAKALAKLSHPNVVTVHDAGVLDGHVYLAMEYVEGSTLRRWLECLTACPRPPWRRSSRARSARLGRGPFGGARGRARAPRFSLLTTCS